MEAKFEQPSESLRLNGENQNTLIHRRARSSLSEEEVQSGEFGTTCCQSVTLGVITGGLHESVQPTVISLLCK